MAGNIQKELENYDEYTYWDLLQERDRWYIFIPRLVYQKPGFSDICNREIDYTKWMLDKIEKIDEKGDKIEVDYIGNIILYFEGGKSKEIKGKFYVKRNTL